MAEFEAFFASHLAEYGAVENDKLIDWFHDLAHLVNLKCATKMATFSDIDWRANQYLHRKCYFTLHGLRSQS